MKKINIAFYLIVTILCSFGLVSTFFYMYLITKNTELQAQNQEVLSNLELLETESYTINSVVYGTCDRTDCINTFVEFDVVDNTITISKDSQIAIKLDRVVTDTITVDFTILLRKYNEVVEKSPDDPRLEYTTSLQPVSGSVISPRPVDYVSQTGSYKEIIEGIYIVANEYITETKVIYYESPVFIVK